MRRLLPLLLGAALCGMAHGGTQPHIDIEVTPAFKGWTRPGRATELDVRVRSDAATPALLDVVGGRESTRAALALQPGRVVRLQVALHAAAAAVVSIAAPAGPTVRRELGLVQSESPLLGLAVATDERVQIEGFHTVALAADDLPRNASAYLSIDALIVDATVLAALDQRQLGALLGHATACGRIVLVDASADLRRLLGTAAGCGGRGLSSAQALPDAGRLLDAALATSLPVALPAGELGALAGPAHAIWNRVALGLAAYLGAALLALVLLRSVPGLLLLPVLASIALAALLHAMQPTSQLVIWSEGESGAQLARYQAWQRFPGAVREPVRVPIPQQLGTSVQSCQAGQPMRFDVDAGDGRVRFAEFDTRLFRQVSLCYAGSFPMSRALAVQGAADGAQAVRNVGARAWPPGTLLAGRLAHALPAVDPGATVVLGAQAGTVQRDAPLRTALARTRADGIAALWRLDLGGVVDAPIDSTGWLLVSAAQR